MTPISCRPGWHQPQWLHDLLCCAELQEAVTATNETKTSFINYNAYSNAIFKVYHRDIWEYNFVEDFKLGLSVSRIWGRADTTNCASHYYCNYNYNYDRLHAERDYSCWLPVQLLYTVPRCYTSWVFLLLSPYKNICRQKDTPGQVVGIDRQLHGCLSMLLLSYAFRSHSWSARQRLHRLQSVVETVCLSIRGTNNKVSFFND